MAKEVIISPLAEINYENILNYLLFKWGIDVTNNFIDRFEQVYHLLSENTEIFPFVNKEKKIKKCVLTKHNILFFTETDDSIEILMIFDTRQDPEKLFILLNF
jgi:plasmid stabilization system protein ParE